MNKNKINRSEVLEAVSKFINDEVAAESFATTRMDTSLRTCIDYIDKTQQALKETEGEI